MTTFIGFAGGSGSGKSTIARKVAWALGEELCATLSFDSFYFPLPDAYRHDPESYNFDEPAALDGKAMVATLEALTRGEDATIPVYDFPTHTRAGVDVVPARPWVLVDGILLLAFPKVRERMDLSVYVDTPEPVRLRRRIERDQVQRGRTLEEILDQYFASVRPMHEQHVEPTRALADLVVDGTAPVEMVAKQVLDALREQGRLTA